MPLKIRRPPPTSSASAVPAESSLEFRRRTKTQALLPSQDAVLLLLFGLLRIGQIRLRRLDGWRELPPVQLSPPEAA